MPEASRMARHYTGARDSAAGKEGDLLPEVSTPKWRDKSREVVSLRSALWTQRPKSRGVCVTRSVNTGLRATREWRPGV